MNWKQEWKNLKQTQARRQRHSQLGKQSLEMLNVLSMKQKFLFIHEASIWPADKDDVMSAKYLPSKVITWISGASTLLIGKWSGGIFSLN